MKVRRKKTHLSERHTKTPGTGLVVMNLHFFGLKLMPKAAR